MSNRVGEMASLGVTDVVGASAVLRALSNPNRLKIFLYLRDTAGEPGCDGEGVCVGDICSELDVAPSTVSHHIRELELVGLVDTQRCGKNVMLNASCETLSEVMAFLTCEVSR